MTGYGIDGNILRRISPFLTDRVQIMAFQGHFWQWKPVTSGIPPGRVLGLLLFVIYINDLPGVISSQLFRFANDTKIFHWVTSDADAEHLQKDLDSLAKWSAKWLLWFHPDKCEVLSVGKSPPMFQHSL